jgi:hypothetical protein
MRHLIRIRLRTPYPGFRKARISFKVPKTKEFHILKRQVCAMLGWRPGEICAIFLFVNFGHKKGRPRSGCGPYLQ